MVPLFLLGQHSLCHKRKARRHVELDLDDRWSHALAFTLEMLQLGSAVGDLLSRLPWRPALRIFRQTHKVLLAWEEAQAARELLQRGVRSWFGAGGGVTQLLKVLKVLANEAEAEEAKPSLLGASRVAVGCGLGAPPPRSRGKRQGRGGRRCAAPQKSRGGGSRTFTAVCTKCLFTSRFTDSSFASWQRCWSIPRATRRRQGPKERRLKTRPLPYREDLRCLTSRRRRSLSTPTFVCERWFSTTKSQTSCGAETGECLFLKFFSFLSGGLSG